MPSKKGSGAGGKLSRSESVTVRLDPKLRYLAEVAGRKQRRTLSSYIEWAVEESLKAVELSHFSNGNDEITVADESTNLWDVDPAERFARLAVNYPDLLTHEEQELWKLLKDSNILKPAEMRQGGQLNWDHVVLRDEVYPAIRRHWPSLIRAFREADEENAVINWVEDAKRVVAKEQAERAKAKGKKSSTGFDDMEDEIPF